MDLQFACELINEVFKNPACEKKQYSTLQNACNHEIVCCDESMRKVCVQCGQFLEENYIVTLHYLNGGSVMKSRKIVDISIYNEIPQYIDCKIKELTVEIFCIATQSKTFRNISKKAIILACLHRASALLGSSNAISYYDLLTMFNLQPHEANKGFTILSSNISKDSRFFLKFDYSREELIGINSKLKLVGLNSIPSLFKLVANVFNLLKTKSDIVNFSQYSSVVCSCIYFWNVYLKLGKSPEEFAILSGISKMTLVKVYTLICDTVFNTILKKLFSELLKNCAQIPIEGSPKFTTVFKKNSKVRTTGKCKYNPEDLIYGPEEKCLVYNPFDSEQIYAEIDNIKLPLDSVDDTLEWNILLSKSYFTPTIKFPLMVTLMKKVDKEMYFDFSEYDKRNNTNGLNILCTVLLNFFDTSIEW